MLVHNVLLGPVYESIKSVWREDMMDIMWIMYIADFIFSFFFVYIFTFGYKGRGFMEGIRYGLFVGGLMIIPGMLNQYTVYNLPFSLIIQWIIYGVIQTTIIGVVVSLIYKSVKEAGSQIT
jgi:hypothetical protein